MSRKADTGFRTDRLRLETAHDGHVWAHASEIAAAVGSGRTSASAVVGAALARIAAHDPALNAFTAVVAERALAQAREAIDAARAQAASRSARSPACRSRSRTCSTSRACRRSPAPRSTATAPPAARDATLIARLEAPGAVLVGALNMGEYAYDFTGENVHDGPSRNPHDTSAHDRRLVRRLGRRGRRRARAARARLRHQRLDPRAGVVLRDFRARSRPMAGCRARARFRSWRASITSARWRASAQRSRARLRRHAGPRSRRSGLRRPPGRAGRRRCSTAAPMACASPLPAAISATARSRRRRRALERVAAALDVAREIELPEAERARAAAYVITASEGAALHLERLRTRARDFDPAVRDRLIAGAMIPAVAGDQGAEIPPLVSRAGARAVRRGRRHPGAGDAVHRARDRPADLRARRRRAAACAPIIGIYTQPISFIGLPVVAVPVPLQAAADRRADHRGALARGHRAADRARAGDKRRRCGANRRPKLVGEGEQNMEIDLPEVVAEVTAAFDALRAGAGVERRRDARCDVPRRSAHHPLRRRARISMATTRSRRSARRARRSGLARTLSRTVITTYGRDFAVASTLFHRAIVAGQGRPPDADLGALSDEGWRVVAAHVSLIDEPAGTCAMTLAIRAKLVTGDAPDVGRAAGRLAEELRLQLADEIVRGALGAGRGARRDRAGAPLPACRARRCARRSASLRRAAWSRCARIAAPWWRGRARSA